MNNARLLLQLLILVAPCAQAESESYKHVDSTLYQYYRWCNNHIRDSAVLLKTDTLFHLSAEKKDMRMQAAALCLKADHYYFLNQLDSLKAWIPRVQAFARKNGQLTYYYFPWTRLILYYTKHTQYTLAQYELERYLAQAAKDDYKPATADAYKQLGHIYRTRSMPAKAIDYYRMSIDLTEQNDLNKFSLCILYSELAGMYMETQQYDLAAEAIEKGKACISLPEYIWTLKLKEAQLMSKTNRIREAKALLREIESDNKDYLSEISILEVKLIIQCEDHDYYNALTTVDVLEQQFRKEGHEGSYLANLYYTRSDIYYSLGDYKSAAENMVLYEKLLREKIAEENEHTLSEFATLLDVNRLDQEKGELLQQAQEERLGRIRMIVIGLSIILLLAALFIVVLTRMNRRLSHAMHAAEEASRMKGIFIRNITHEINTPLNAIVGFAELAAMTPAGDDERRTYIGIIQENSGYLQKLIDDVLYIADIESSGTPPALAPFDLNACCRLCIRTVMDDFPQSPAIVFLPGREFCTVTTSRTLISKVLTELLRNALRFAPESPATLAYTLDETEHTLTFAVTDKGPGIPAADAERIFERFVKLSSFSQGMGLGLFVARLVADALGGTLRLGPAGTKGASFLFTIPLKQA